MADNIAITAGAGTTVAADDVGGVFYQRVKLSLGADGAAVDAPVAGGTEAGTLRVTLPTDCTGQIKLAAGTAEIGKLAAGTAIIGSAKTAPSGRVMVHAKVALAASQTGATVITPTSGKRFFLKKIVVSCKTAGDVYFFDHTDNSASAIGPALTFAVAGGWTETWDANDLYTSSAINQLIKYTSGAGFTGSVYLDYSEE